MNKVRAIPLILALIYIAGVGLMIFRAPIYNDDPYITFRYAWNFAHGNGLVYNAGEYVAGSTTPLYSLVLGVMMWCGMPLRAGVGVLAAVAYALISVFSWRMFRRLGIPWGGVVLPVLLLANPTLISLYGNETSLAVGLALAAFSLHAEGRLNAAFIVSAILVGVRPDGALVGIVLALVTLENDKRRLWPALAWSALVFLPFYIAFAVYYQALVPHTLAVKTAQGAASDVAPFWKGTLQFVEGLLTRQALPTGILTLIGITLIIKKRWAPLPLFVLLYALAFCLINPPYYYWWYQYPYWLMRDAAVAWAIGWIAVLPMWQHRQGITWMRHLAAAILLIGICFATHRPDRAKVNQYRARYVCYEKAADFIKNRHMEQKRIICEEIGIIGYELPEWKIYDMAGLVHLRRYTELIGGDAPSLAIIRGDQKDIAISTAAGGRVTYRQISLEQEGDFACSLMRRM